MIKGVKNKNVILILGILLGIFLLLGIIGFAKKVNSPFELAIKGAFSQLKSNKIIDDMNKVSLDISFKTKDEEIIELNDFGLKLETSYDANNLETFINAKFLNNKKELFELKSYLDSGNKFYIKMDKLFNKVLYVDLEEDYFQNKIEKEDIEYLIDMTENAVINAFKDETMEYKKKNVSINGKEKEVLFNYYKIDRSNVSKIIKNLIETYKNDDKTIDLLSKYTFEDKETIKDELEEIIPEYKNSESEDRIEIGVYTRGLAKNIVGFGIVYNEKEYFRYIETRNYFYLEAREDKYDKLVIETKDDNTNIHLKVDGDSIINGDIKKISKNKYDADIKIMDELRVLAKIEFDKIKKIEKFDTSNVGNVNKITSEDEKIIYKNFRKIITEAGLNETLGIKSLEDEFYENVLTIYEDALYTWRYNRYYSYGAPVVTYSNKGTKLKSSYVPSDLDYSVTIDQNGEIQLLIVSNEDFYYDSGSIKDLKESDIKKTDIKKKTDI